MENNPADIILYEISITIYLNEMPDIDIPKLTRFFNETFQGQEVVYNKPGTNVYTTDYFQIPKLNTEILCYPYSLYIYRGDHAYREYPNDSLINIAQPLINHFAQKTRSIEYSYGIEIDENIEWNTIINNFNRKLIQPELRNRLNTDEVSLKYILPSILVMFKKYNSNVRFSIRPEYKPLTRKLIPNKYYIYATITDENQQNEDSSITQKIHHEKVEQMREYAKFLFLK